MPLCNRLLLCSYGNFPSLAHPLLSTQRLLFIFHPKLSMAYSEGDGVRSVGQTDSEQKGRFVESPFLGFPIHLVHKGAKGVNGFTSAVLASAQLGTGLRPPFCLMDRNRVSLEPGLTPALASIVAWTSVDARQPSAPSSMPWRSTSMICSIQHAVEDHLNGSLPPSQEGGCDQTAEESQFVTARTKAW